MSKYTLNVVSTRLTLPDDIVNAYRLRYSSSIDFVDKVLQRKRNDNREFLTYDFNLLEIVKALKDEIRTMYLFRAGVPISKWGNRGEHAKIEVNDELIDSVFESYNEAQDALFDNEKIGLLSHPISETEENWEDYYSLYSVLLLRIPHLLTQDAMIVSACLFHDIEFLITKDEDLKKLGGQIGDAISETDLHLRIIDPGDTSIWK